jgi:hypothetical protein
MTRQQALRIGRATNTLALDMSHVSLASRDGITANHGGELMLLIGLTRTIRLTKNFRRMRFTITQGICRCRWRRDARYCLT